MMMAKTNAMGIAKRTYVGIIRVKVLSYSMGIACEDSNKEPVLMMLYNLIGERSFIVKDLFNSARN